MMMPGQEPAAEYLDAWTFLITRIATERDRFMFSVSPKLLRLAQNHRHHRSLVLPGARPCSDQYFPLIRTVPGAGSNGGDDGASPCI